MVFIATGHAVHQLLDQQQNGSNHFEYNQNNTIHQHLRQPQPMRKNLAMIANNKMDETSYQ